MTSIALYIHTPWCIHKCPYCDFNSHQSPGVLPEDAYIDALIEDLNTDCDLSPYRNISSIFIGGGTPSLISVKAYERLFKQLRQKLNFAQDIEITLEANPGTVEQSRFEGYRALGINRLSLGIQSFNPKHLKILGRIHDDLQARHAIIAARQAGFDNINLDLMYGLPEQSLEQGLDDLSQALNHEPEHLSWYQLTLEPNTVFYKKRPVLPDEDVIESLEQAGLSLLSQAGFERYEISAYCKNQAYAQHNLNYWTFGDYLGIGAGAHGKITLQPGFKIYRSQKQRQPKDYLNPKHNGRSQIETVAPLDLPFEFMLNATRLEAPIAKALFQERTGLLWDSIMPTMLRAQSQGLITLSDTHWQITPLGRRFTNDLQELFLAPKS